MIRFFLIRNINIQDFPEYTLGVKIHQKDKSQPSKREELDQIFEETLRPLQSRNARHIYLVLRDSETEYLTTYDIQPMLEQQGNKLSKVELNNWLSALLDAGLVKKALERGKPTTRLYNRRYTYDLWKLSKKGRETASLLEVFRGNTPTLTVEKVVTKTVEKNVEIPKFPELDESSFEDLEKIQALSFHLSLLHALSSVDQMDLMTLSEKTGLTAQRIVEFIEYQEKLTSNTLYFLSEIPLDLRGKILQTIGLSPRKNYNVSLSPMGLELLSNLSP
jgi:DNA-binding transcriptional ArsR family regulator